MNHIFARLDTTLIDVGLVCYHCGGFQPVKLRIDIDYLGDLCKLFNRYHKKCKENETGKALKLKHEIGRISKK